MKRAFLIFIFIVLCLLAVRYSLQCDTVGIIISSVGSIASLYAIIEAFVKVKSIETQNKEIKAAVSDRIIVINKKETAEQINKYIEVISRIQAFINLRNADAALLKIEELQLFLYNLQCNPTTSQDMKATLSKHIRILKQDAIVLLSKNQGEAFPIDADCKELNRNFEAIHDILMKYSQQIHFDK